jgi:hypothetical protein
MEHPFVRLWARRPLWAALILLAVAVVPRAGAAEADRDRDRSKGKKSGNAALQQTLDVAVMNVNNVQFVFDNKGILGFDPRSGSGAGFFPGNSPNNYVFSTGIWVGGLVNGTKIVSEGYDFSGGFSEYIPGRSSDRTGGDILCSDNAADLAQWYPEFSDASGAPLLFSQKDCINMYFDSNQSADVTTPIGLEVRQRIMAFTFGSLSQVIFVVWDVENIGTNIVNDAFVGVASDMDIGANAVDDRCSAVPLVPPGANNSSAETVATNLGICWDNDFNEGQFNPNPPGFVGVTFFQGPVSDVGDTLGMVRFTLTTNPSSGRPQPDPATDGDMYDLLAGIGARAPFIDATAADVRIVEISGPITFQPGQVQRTVAGYVFANAANGRTALNVDPNRCFDLGPPPCGGDRPGFLPDPNDPVLEEVITVQRAAQVIFDAGFLAPAPPVKPDLTLIPGDGEVTIAWTDISQEPDPFFNVAGDPTNPAFDPLYREFDFEGYVVVRSTSGDPATVDTLAIFDLADGVTQVDDTTFGTFTVGDTVVTIPTSVRTLITLPDQGLQFSFKDQGLINGITYFYDVVPFDFNPSNTLRGPGISLSGGISFQPREVKSVRPRSDASSFSAASLQFNALKADGTVCDTSEPAATIDPATGAYSDLLDCSNAIVQATLSPLRDLNIPSGDFFFVIDSILPADFDPTGANTETGEPGYIVAEGSNIVWYHWDDGTGAVSNAVQPSVGSFTQGTLFTSPRFNVGTQTPLAFSLDTNPSDVGPDLAINLVVAMDFAHIEDLEVNGQSVGLLRLGGEETAASRPHDVASSSFADDVLLSTGRKVGGAFREYSLTGGSYTGAASYELTWSVSGGSYTGTLRRLPGGEIVPQGGQPKGPDNPSTPQDFIAGYNWGFITGTPDALPPATDCTAAVFGGADCGSVKEHIYPGAGPLTNSINLNLGDTFALLVPGNDIYIEGLKQLPQNGDVWVVRLDPGGDRLGNFGRLPTTDGDPIAGPFTYGDANQGYIPALVTNAQAIVNVYPGARWRLSLGGGSNDPSAADLDLIKTVPNPYVANAVWDFSQDSQRLEFVNLPPECTIRIYTVSGNLVRVLEHNDGSGTAVWDLRTRFNLKAASGTYYWHVTTPDGNTKLGLLSIIQNDISSN